MKTEASPSTRPAFTTVELLVAILIVASLAAIVVWGIGNPGKGAKIKQTRSTFENYKSLLQEVKTRRQPSQVWVNGSQQTPVADTPTDFWLGVVAAPKGNMSLEVPHPDGSLPSRFTSDAVLNTQSLMKMIRSVPKNQEAIRALPSDQVLKVPGSAQIGNLSVITENNNGRTEMFPDPPLLLDGWGNPIIYVPRGGLTNVYLAARGNTVPVRITSAGIDPSQVQSNQKVPAPAGAQPFFASAGPDGAFDLRMQDNGTMIPAGDDNIYSFEN